MKETRGGINQIVLAINGMPLLLAICTYKYSTLLACIHDVTYTI